MNDLPSGAGQPDVPATAAATTPANRSPRGQGCLRAIGCASIPVFLLLSLVAVFLVEIPFHLLFGWLRFLTSAAPRIEFALSQAVFFLALIVGFAFGLHQLCRCVVNPTWSAAASWRITGLALVAFVAGISIVGMTHQAIWLAQQDEILSSPHMIARMQSRSHLKQIGLAFHNYHDAYGSFPTVPKNSIGLPTHSWATALLPYIDQAHLSTRMNLLMPSDAEPNSTVAESVIPTYLNPAIVIPRNDAPKLAPIHYAANVHVQATQGIRIREVKDGTSGTLFVGEINTRIPAWSTPSNWRDPSKGINRVPNGFGSPFDGICLFMMMDGSVQSIREDIDLNTLKALATPDGGEIVGEY